MSRGSCYFDNRDEQDDLRDDWIERQEAALPDQIKPGTCGACISFKPPPGIMWRKITHPKAFDPRIEGWCMNGVACLGAVLLTGRDSTCKHFKAADETAPAGERGE